MNSRLQALVFVIAFLFIVFVAAGQSEAQLASTSKFHIEGEEYALDALKVGTTYDVFISTATIPITFSKLVKDEAGDYTVGAQLGIGVGYLWILGTMTPQADGNARIDPGLFFGPAGDIGVRNEGDELKTAFSLGAIIGYDVIAATVGYDFLAESVYIGLSGTIDFFSLRKDSFVEHWTRARQ